MKITANTDSNSLRSSSNINNKKKHNYDNNNKNNYYTNNYFNSNKNNLNSKNSNRNNNENEVFGFDGIADISEAIQKDQYDDETFAGGNSLISAKLTDNQNAISINNKA